MKHSDMLTKMVDKFMENTDEALRYAASEYRVDLYLLDPNELMDEYEAMFGVREELDVDGVDEADEEVDEAYENIVGEDG